MTSPDKSTIEALSQLCRIGCSDEELDALLKDLKGILHYIDQLKEVNTENVAPCNHVLEGMANVMREDVVGKPMPRDLFLANAPAHVGGMIRVPTVIKSKSQ